MRNQDPTPGWPFQRHINDCGIHRYSIRSRDLSEVRAELKRRGENNRGVAGPVSVWFFRESLDAMFVSRSNDSGIWIQFGSVRDFDEMHEYIQQMSSEKDIAESEFISGIIALGSTTMILANPPYEF